MFRRDGAGSNTQKGCPPVVAVPVYSTSTFQLNFSVYPSFVAELLQIPFCKSSHADFILHFSCPHIRETRLLLVACVSVLLRYCLHIEAFMNRKRYQSYVLMSALD